eukprot:5239655-Pyramimonas_sp.AAC.1
MATSKARWTAPSGDSWRFASLWAPRTSAWRPFSCAARRASQRLLACAAARKTSWTIASMD